MKIWQRIAVILFIIALQLLIAVPVRAISLPTSTSIDETYAYRNLIQSGDILVLAVYNIAYGTIPPESIDDTFIFRLIDTDNTTELGSVLAYPYNDNGYGQGIIAFYFDNATAPTWGESYIVRVSGNPVYFTDPPESNFVIPSSAYYSLSTQDANQTALAARIISIANGLEIAWTDTLTTDTDAGGTVLDSSGQLYFTNSIPGLQSMAPGAFFVEIVDPTYTPRTWSTARADAYRDRFVGTWVMNSMEAFGDLFTVGTQLATGIPVFIICIGLIIANAAKFQTATPGFLDAFQILLCGVLLGFVSMAVNSVIALACGVFVLYILLFERE